MHPTLKVIAGTLAGVMTLWITACSKDLPEEPSTGAPQADVTIAQVPANDDFDDAVVITTLPFTDNLNTSEATTAADDPADPEDPAVCFIGGHTVWYQFTPSEDTRIDASTFGSDFDTGIAVFTGTRGALTLIGCNDDLLTGRNRQSILGFDAVAGETYYFMVGSCCGTDGGNLVFNVDVGRRGQDRLEHTYVFQDEGSFTYFDDCLGEEVLFAFNNRDVFFSRRDARGNLHLRVKVLDVKTTLTGLTSGIVWHASGPGEIVGLNGDDSSEEAPGTFTFLHNFTLIGQGTTTNLRVRERFHVTVNANGTVSVERGTFKVVCR